jgi:prephenate dehydrogenase
VLHTVGIVGLGLIGGSLAKALRGRVPRLIGVDPRVRAPELIDADGPLSECDLVVLAAPLSRLPALVAPTARRMRPDATLMDVASVKGPVFDAVRKLRRRVNFVSGHPMAGTERRGFENARADLFQNRPFLLIPGPTWGRRTAQLAERFVRAIGARPVWLDTPQEHDLAMALVSHLPHALAAALFKTAGSARPLAGPSFQDATRVSHSPPRAVADFMLSNRKFLLKAIGRFEGSLRELKAALRRGRRSEFLALLKRFST